MTRKSGNRFSEKVVLNTNEGMILKSVPSGKARLRAIEPRAENRFSRKNPIETQ